MPNWKPCGPTVNERQIVSALVVDYIHSHSRQMLLTPLGQCVGGGSIDWHFSQFLTTALTDALETVGLTCLTKYNVRLGTLVRLSSQLRSDLTRTASTDSPYSLTRLASASSHHLISISLGALVRTLAFPVRVSVIHLCTHTESVWRCNIVAFHINAMFTPFSTASSSTKFMCCVSFSFRDQLASSTAAPSCSSDTVVYWPLTRPNMPFQRRRKCIFHCRGRAWLTIWDRVKIPRYSHKVMHQKRMTCELHDSYFHSMTIKHAIPKTAEVHIPMGSYGKILSGRWTII